MEKPLRWYEEHGREGEEDAYERGDGRRGKAKAGTTRGGEDREWGKGEQGD